MWLRHQNIFDWKIVLCYAWDPTSAFSRLVPLKRLPITPLHLREMINFIERSFVSLHDKTMWHCLILPAFFGLLRVSEYTCKSVKNYDSSINIRHHIRHNVFQEIQYYLTSKSRRRIRSELVSRYLWFRLAIVCAQWQH